MSQENLQRREVFFYWFEGDGDALPGEEIYFITSADLGYTDENFIAQRKVFALHDTGARYKVMLWCDQDSHIDIDWKVQFPKDPTDDKATLPSQKSFSLAYGPGTPIGLGTLLALGSTSPIADELLYQSIYAYILALIADGTIGSGGGGGNSGGGVAVVSTNQSPHLADFTNGQFAVHKNTANGQRQLIFRDGSSLFTAPLVLLVLGDQTAPSDVTGLAAGTPTSSSIPLDWTDAADNVGVTDYVIQRATNSAFTAGLVETLKGDAVSAKNVSGLSPSTTYYFRVKAKDAGGTLSANWSNVVTAATAAATGNTLIKKIKFMPRAGLPERMLSGQIQGTTDNFATVTNLGTITVSNPDVYNTVEFLSNTIPFTAIRIYYPDAGQYGDCAEIRALNESDETITPTGYISSTPFSSEYSADKAGDGDPASAFVGNGGAGVYIGMTF